VEPANIKEHAMSEQADKTISLHDLQQAMAGRASALRCRTQLQPAGGAGDKVFPPTYAGAAYATEKRRIPGREDPVECVLLDSVQSQANRMEEALQQAVDEGRVSIPVIDVDFSGNELLTEIGRVTSLQAPHRIADAILRDSLLDGVPFRRSELGKRLDAVSFANATPLYELCPTALLFGMWDSTGPKGGLGAKFQRAMVSEIVGIDAVYGVKTSSRIDPLQIRAR
jgi:CRISPR-associated protein Csb1